MGHQRGLASPKGLAGHAHSADGSDLRQRWPLVSMLLGGAARKLATNPSTSGRCVESLLVTNDAW